MTWDQLYQIRLYQVLQLPSGRRFHILSVNRDLSTGNVELRLVSGDDWQTYEKFYRWDAESKRTLAEIERLERPDYIYWSFTREGDEVEVARSQRHLEILELVGEAS